MINKQNIIKSIKYQIKRKDYGSKLYFFALVFFLIALFFKSTLFIPGFLSYSFLYKLIQIDSLLIIFKVVFLDEHHWQFLTGVLLFMGALFYVQNFSRNFDIFYYALFILGSYQIDFQKILKIFLTVNVPLTFFTIIATILQIIPNQVQGRVGNSNVIRYSMGFLSPTDFAARVFYLVLCYVVLRKMKLKLEDYIVFIGTTWLIYSLTNARLDTLLLILLMLIAILFSYVQKPILRLGHVAWFIGAVMYIILTLFISYIYSPTSLLLAKINSLLSGRLEYGQIALKEHGISIMGQVVKEHGNGGIQHGPFRYFFVDSSFIRLFVMLGFITTLIFFISLFFLFKKLEKNRAIALVIYVCFILLSSAFDQHLLDPSYNVVFLALLADLNNANTEVARSDYCENLDDMDYKRYSG